MKKVLIDRCADCPIRSELLCTMKHNIIDVKDLNTFPDFCPLVDVGISIDMKTEIGIEVQKTLSISYQAAKELTNRIEQIIRLGQSLTKN